MFFELTPHRRFPSSTQLCEVTSRYIKSDGRSAESGVGINFNLDGLKQLQVHSVVPDGEARVHATEGATGACGCG